MKRDGEMRDMGNRWRRKEGTGLKKEEEGRVGKRLQVQKREDVGGKSKAKRKGRYVRGKEETEERRDRRE